MKSLIRFIIIFVLSMGFFAVSGVALALDALVDHSFGVNGSVITTIGNKSSIVDLSVLPNGKIVTLGSVTGFTQTRFVLARYNSSGQLDSTFGLGGIVTIPVWSSIDRYNSILLDSNNRILIGGKFYPEPNPGSTPSVLAVMRFNENGTSDSAFGSNGIFTWTLASGHSLEATDMAFQSDNKIIVTGHYYGPSGNQVIILRLMSNGILDSGFALGAGYIVNNYCPSSVGSYGGFVAVRSDDKIVATGQDLSSGIGVIQLTQNGLLDSSFGTNGLTCINIAPFIGPSSLMLQTDNKIVIPSGYSYFGANAVFISRLTITGTLDAEFGGTGTVSIGIPQAADGNPPAAGVIQNDGKIIIATQIVDDFALIRVNPSGERDNSFGPNGILTNSVGSNYNSPRAIFLQSDKKLVIGGQSGPTSEQWHIAVLRFTINLDKLFLPLLSR